MANKHPPSSEPAKWSPPIGGIIHWMGFPDSGKTSISLSVPGLLPEGIVMLDFDGKSQPLADGFAAKGRPMHYSNMLTLCYQKKPAEIFKIASAEIARHLEACKLPQTIIFDNWTPMEGALWEHFADHITEYSNHTVGQARSANRGVVFPEFRRFYSGWLQEFLKVTPLVQVITHVKNQTVNGQKIPGVFEASAQVPMTTLPNARFWLLASQLYSGAPEGLVLKRLTSMEITDSGLVPINVFPQKLSPCTWERIAFYVENPVGNRELLPHERVSETESYLVGGEWSADQKLALSAAIEFAKLNPQEQEAEEVTAALEPWAIEARELIKLGQTPPAIYQALKPKFEGITIPAIVALAQ